MISIQNTDTVNKEIFARVLFSRNFAYVKFCENNTLAKWQKLFAIIMSKSQFLNVANLSFNDICENKILANISEFTVVKCTLLIKEGLDGVQTVKYFMISDPLSV